VAGTNGFSSVLVGGTALLAECGRILLARGGRVGAVVPAGDMARRWASEHGIPVVEHGPDLAARLAGVPCDYLFSLANPRLLPEPVLRLARVLPVGFHDGPLPADAGLHATCWAVWRGARRHGVTWHVLTEVAGAGDVLARRSVDVPPGETAHSLNLRCLQAGVESFADLLGELLAGTARPVPQDLAARTFHGPWDRPAGGLRVSWRWPAERIRAATLACDLGPQPNAFGLLKVWTGTEYLVVRAAEVVPDQPAPAGAVVATDGETVTVATTDGGVRLRLTTLTGGRPDRAPRPGQRLPEPEPGLAAAYRAGPRHEAYWLDRLRDLTPLDVPHRSTVAGFAVADERAWRELPVAVPAGRDTGILGAAALAYLARLAGRAGDVGLAVRPPSALFSPVVPVRVPGPGAGLPAYRRAVEEARHHGSYPLDLTLRHADVAGVGRLPMALALDRESTVDADLVVSVHDGECRLGFDSGVLPEWVAGELAEGLAAFLAVVADGVPPSEAPLLSPAQAGRIGGWNATAAPYPARECVTALISARARRRPEATAVHSGTASLSYAELDRRAAALAGVLASRGIAPGGRVGVYLSRDTDLVVTLLAVLRAGAAYVPLDPQYPRERTAAMLAGAGAGLVVTTTALAADLPAVGMVALDQETLDGGPAPDLATPDGLAYVTYTSGTTGEPKGVDIPHRALVNLLWSMAATAGPREGELMLAVTTVCLGGAVLEILGPLVTGGTVELVPAEVAADGAALAAWVTTSRPSVMRATPATWRMLVAAGWTGDPGSVANGAGHPGLRVLCGGETLPPALAAELLVRAGEVWNLYGPTETTIWSTAARVRPGEPVTIGRPVANTICHVLDPGRRPLPPGAAGELWIGGHGLARGYRDRPDLTAARFRETPYGRLYRTGDLARWTGDGELEFLGRLDHQVEPGSGPDTARTGRAPRTDRERQVCALFAEVLGVETVMADDDFHALGGTSLTALRLAARARDAGLPLALHDVYAHPSPAGLAAHLTEPSVEAFLAGVSEPHCGDSPVASALIDDYLMATGCLPTPPR